MKPSEVQTTIAQRLFGLTPAEARERCICISCKKPATRFTDEQSHLEYQISLLCQACQDLLFKTEK
jgi:hypothetical protein